MLWLLTRLFPSFGASLTRGFPPRPLALTHRLPDDRGNGQRQAQGSQCFAGHKLCRTAIACCAVVVGSAVVVTGTTGCAVIYPEFATPVRPAPPDAEMDPPPPPDLYYIAVVRAEVPPRTRDGRAWDDSGGGEPDPFAVVFINDTELFRTATERDSFQPTWPEAKRTNYRVPKDATLKVEVWNDNPLHAQPICVQTVRNVRREAADTGELDLYCDGGARIVVQVEPAKARWGLGFHYELDGGGATVTRVVRHSPASRGGLRGGEEMLIINGRKVARMDEKGIRSTINANIRTGLELTVRTNGEVREIKLQEGPIYTLEDEK